MVCNQCTITDAISKEVEWLEDISKIYTAGKTEMETRNVNASKVGESTIRDQNKGQKKTVETISWSAFHAERETQVYPLSVQALYCLFFFFLDCALSVAMTSHAITVISKAVKYLKQG